MRRGKQTGILAVQESPFQAAAESSTNDMATTDRDRWNAKYAQRTPEPVIVPDEWLIESCEMIAKSENRPRSSQRACDIACGLGHNSLWLARQGWKVDGVDIAAEGLKLARQSASYGIAEVNWLEADLDEWLPTSDYYDLAIVFRFLDRVTIPQIINTGLRRGGWLVYETFAAGQLSRSDSHIRNPASALA
ncbi:MAG: class I SAM-dependent methyltransferase, partial [Planctomycetota bacterium]|nr:class I SAM-dependent methyltransferase [Planctomycetota bacterium]